MANKFKGEVDVILDKPRTFFFSNNSLAELEEETGHSMFDEEVFKKPSITLMRTLVKHALKKEIPDITDEDAGKLMDYAESRMYVMTKVMEAYTLSMTGDDEITEDKESTKKKKK